MTVQQLKDKMAANSAAWHETQDEKVRDALHQANVALYGQLDAQTGSTSGFDSATGKWSSSEPGTGNYQAVGAPEVRDLSGQVTRRQRAATDSAIAGLERAKAASLAALDAEEAALPGIYTAAKNRTAAQNEIERKNTAAWASDKGLSSGAAGQIALSQSVAAQNDLNGLELQETAAREDIGRRKSQMELDYAMAVAEAEAEGDYALADALYKEASRFDAAQRQQWLDTEEMGREVYETARKNVTAEAQRRAQEAADAYEKEQDALGWAFKLEERDYDRAQDAWERQRKESQDAWERQRDLVSENLRRQSLYNTSRATQLRLAQDLADHGDFSGYKGLGYSQSQIDAMTGLWQKYMAEKGK